MRSAIRHLQSGGTLVYFGAGHRDPDPATYPGARAMLDNWLEGIDFFFKHVPDLRLLPFNGWHRFLPVLVHGAGARTREVPVHHRPRVAGVSKYGVWNRLGRGLFDLVGVAWYLRRRLLPVPSKRLEDS